MTLYFASSGNEPNPQFVTSRVTVLKAAILLKQSYVALCLDNPTGAFRSGFLLGFSLTS